VLLRQVPRSGRVSFFQNLDSRTVQAAYSHARALLFPSLEEGFGWPLIEATACGCPVLTTDHPPMSEIAGPAAAYVPRLQPHEDLDVWAKGAARVLKSLLRRSASERSDDLRQAAQWIQRFDAERAIDRYLEIYRSIIAVGAAADAADWQSPTGMVS
jgi:glycosyltransferase involved in cell wall biosynthesis